MLDTPKLGWSKIHIWTWSDRCSYLDDVPMKLLEAFFCTKHFEQAVQTVIWHGCVLIIKMRRKTPAFRHGDIRRPFLKNFAFDIIYS